jgi:SAM-dependent methyltransferase
VVTVIDYDSIAEIYDLYANADYDIPFFVSEARKVKGPVLELMAGTGRVSVSLLEAGAILTCVDGSQGMLDVLSRKLASRGLQADVRLADVRHLDLPPSFELAVLPFHAFMELVSEDDRRKTLAAVAAALVPGGRFICTLHNPAPRRASVDGVLRAVGAYPVDDGILVVSGFEQGGHPVVRRQQFFELFGHDGRLEWKRLLPMEFALVERAEFEGMARSAGFRVAALYGSYERAEFDPPTSGYMIWVLERDRRTNRDGRRGSGKRR